MWLTGLVASAVAGPLHTWGAGEVGLAGNAGVATDGAFAAWYNPAAIHAERFDASGEYLQATGTLVAAPAGGQPSDIEAGAKGAMVGAELNTYWLGLPKGNLGIALFLPTEGPFHWDEVRKPLMDLEPLPVAPRWGSEQERLDVTVGGGYQVHDRVAVGAGVDISASFVTLTFATVEDFDNAEEADRGQDVLIKPTFHPTLGALVLVGDPEGRHARIGAIGRTGRSMDDSGTTTVTMLGGNFLFHHQFVRYYAPPSLTVGTDLRLIDPVSVRLETSYEAWSRAIGPFGEDLAGDWFDTITARLGVRVQTGPVRAMAGYGYDPSPATDVPRGTLHVDGPDHALSAGLAAVLYQRDARALSARLGLVAHQIPDRTLASDTPREVALSGSALAFRLGVGWGL